MKLLIVFLFAMLVSNVVGPPVKPNKGSQSGHKEDAGADSVMDVEYSRYLTEIVQALEEDDFFRNKLQNASEDEIKSGGIARELEFVNHNVRTKLDEIKRSEVDRIKHMIRQQDELTQGLDRKQIKIPSHLDHRNQHTFEIEDLKKLILQATKDIEEADEKRRQEFKNYEMEKERDRIEKMKAMDEAHRKQAQEEYEANLKKHKEHPKLHHPGTKEQFKEVWEKEDQLPAEEFDLKTFFRMHDIDADGHWSIEEVKAIFRNELNKMYNANMTEDDMRERAEEMERMREHVLRESDLNRDGMISYKEFVEYSKRKEFEEDPGWQGLDEQQVYTKEEYEAYEKHRREELAQMAAAGINPWGGPAYYPDQYGQGQYPPPMPGQVPPGAYHPQQQQYQQAPPQQYHQQVPPQQYHQQVPQQQYQHVPQQQYQQVPVQHQQFQQQPPNHQQPPVHQQVPQQPSDLKQPPAVPQQQNPPQQQAQQPQQEQQQGQQPPSQQPNVQQQ